MFSSLQELHFAIFILLSSYKIIYLSGDDALNKSRREILNLSLRYLKESQKYIQDVLDEEEETLSDMFPENKNYPSIERNVDALYEITDSLSDAIDELEEVIK